MKTSACLTVYMDDVPFDCECELDLIEEVVSIESVSIKGDGIDHNKLHFERDGIVLPFAAYFTTALQDAANTYIGSWSEARRLTRLESRDEY